MFWKVKGLNNVSYELGIAKFTVELKGTEYLAITFQQALPLLCIIWNQHIIMISIFNQLKDRQ